VSAISGAELVATEGIPAFAALQVCGVVTSCFLRSVMA
jgi:hypothetical protein